MTPDQFEKLLEILKTFGTYTITGAADWPLFAYIVSAFAALIVGLLCYIWHDLKITIKDNKTEWKTDLDKEVHDRKEQNEQIWTEVRRCQEKCC